MATLFISTALVPAVADSQEVGRTIIPVGSQWPGERPWQIDISDDGRFVIYHMDRGDGFRLYLHELGQSAAREIPGLGDYAYFGHLSPDGEWVMFGKKASVYKAPVSGGKLTRLHTANLWNAWETNETILVTKGSGGVWRVRADGSMQEEQVAPVDTAAGATNYGPPSVLPGGKGVLTSVGFGTGVDLRKVGVVSLPGGRLTLLDETGINPRWAESGHILYTQGDALKAIPFDLDRMEPSGPSATIVEGVHTYSNGGAQFAISRNGVLIYVPGKSDLNRGWPRTLVWVDRDGKETAFDAPAEKGYGVVRLSPNRRFVAAEVGASLYLFDRQSGQWSVLSDAANSGAPIWSGDSQTLYYSRAGVLGRQSVGDGGSWEELWRGDTEFWGFSLTADGNQVVGTEWLPETRLWRLMRIALDGTPRPGPVAGSADQLRRNPALSPDGKWLAYVEKTDGIDHVWVQPFQAAGQPVLVSEGGSNDAAEPMWGRYSSELLYRDATHVVSVQLETTPALRVKGRTRLFRARPYYQYLNTFATVFDYDPATDRFLMSRWSIPDPPGTDLHVIENAFELLNRLAPRR